MSNYKFHLFQLQKIDSRLGVLLAEVEKANFSIHNDSKLNSAITSKDHANVEVQENTLGLSKIEQQIQEKRVKLEQCESSLYQGKISNPKELQDIQKETLIIKNQISILEESQLASLFEVEKSHSLLKIAEKELEAALAQNTMKNATLHGMISSHESEIKNLEHEKNLIISQLPIDIVSRYNELFLKKKGLVVSKTEEGSCSICGATLTPAQNQQAKSPSSLTYCPSCGRILYAD